MMIQKLLHQNSLINLIKYILNNFIHLFDSLTSNYFLYLNEDKKMKLILLIEEKINYDTLIVNSQGFNQSTKKFKIEFNFYHKK